MSQQSAAYSEMHATKAGLSLTLLGLSSWDEAPVEALQKKIGLSGEDVDGWFGPQSVAAWKAWSKKNQPTAVVPLPPEDNTLLSGLVILDGRFYSPPLGLKVRNFQQKDGLPAEEHDTDKRQAPVTQFVFHLGAEGRMGLPNYAAATETILDQKGLSTTFTMDVDGTIYQHFDPSMRQGRHAPNHNHQSDSLDVAGPFSKSTKALSGQMAMTYMMAIGRKNDGLPPRQRQYGQVKCWSMTPKQSEALRLFVPWYCKLRGIPLTACRDWRTFRVGGLGLKDPVTNVKGLLAHCQIAGPGERVDGIRELDELLRANVPIQWRDGKDFFNT